jgi:hypothetical protein
MKRGILTPHYDIKLDKSGTIKSATISPMIEPQLAKSGLMRFLNDNGYEDKIDISISKIPIRY